VATGFLIDYQPCDATTAPSDTLGVRWSIDGKLYGAAGSHRNVLALIEDLTRCTDDHIGTLDAGRFLALLLWKRDGDAADRFRALIDRRRVVSVEDLAWVLGADSMGRYQTDEPDRVADQAMGLWAEAQYRLLPIDRRTHPGGLNLETIGNAAAVGTSWRGAHVSISRAQALANAPDHKEMETFLSTVRDDGTIHPLYSRSRFARLHARSPGVQSLSVEDGHRTPPRSLIVPPGGQFLVGIDIKMAELDSAVATWRKLYPDDPRVHALDQQDHHRLTGSILPPTVPNHRRDAGKALNFCLINLGGYAGAARAVHTFRGSISEPDFKVVQDHVNQRFPLDRWSVTASEHTGAGRTTTILGRTIKVSTSGQFSAAHLQSIVADALTMGILTMQREWIYPCAMVYDEILFPAPDEAALNRGVQAFHRGLSQTLPGWLPGLTVKLYPKCWGAQGVTKQWALPPSTCASLPTCNL